MDILTSTIEDYKETIEEEIRSKMFPDLDDKLDAIKEAEESGKSKNLPKGTAEKIKAEAKKAVESYFNSILSKIKELAPKIQVLTYGIESVGAQLTSAAVKIIGSCAVGPTVNPNSIPSDLQGMKIAGDNLSKECDDVSRIIGDLEKVTKSIPIDIIQTAIGTAKDAVVGAKGVATSVGSPCTGLPKPDMPEVTPPIEFEYDPNDCTAYSGEEEPGSRTCLGCSNFEELIKGKERSCNNCKHFNK